MYLDVVEGLNKIPPDLTTVLFDLDGTLLDSREMLVNTAYRTAKEFDLDSLTLKEISEHFGMGFSNYLSDFGSDKKKIDAFFTNEKAASYHLNLFFPKVKAGLHRLVEQGVLLGIVTNQQSNLVMEVLEKHKLEKFFDVIITKDDVVKQKPSAEPILLAMKQLDVNQKQVLMVGDTSYDRLSAKRAGVTFAHVNFYESALCQEEDFFFSDFGQLVEFILKNKKEGVKNG